MSTRRPQQHRELLHETTPESTLVDTEPDGVETVIIHADGSYHQENDRSGTGFTLEKKTVGIPSVRAGRPRRMRTQAWKQRQLPRLPASVKP